MSTEHSTESTPSSEPKTNGILEAFEAEIVKQEDLLYGVALFFEGVSMLLAGQDAVIETYRNQYWNIIQEGNAAAERAHQLLEEARRDPSKIPLVERFTFSSGKGHARQEELIERAHIMVETYESLYPNRPRDQALSEEETLRIMEAASINLPE